MYLPRERGHVSDTMEQKGSMTSEILIDILSDLDHLQVMDRSDERKPFFYLTGMGVALDSTS